jgi:SagB-type dehydrogenase family enzyme
LPASLLLSWSEGVSTEIETDGALRVQGSRGRVTLRQLSPAILTALDRLKPPGAEEDRLTQSLLETDGAAALAAWYYTLQGLARRGLVCRAVQADGQRLALLLPASSTFHFTPSLSRGDGPFLLSRFAYLRREGEALVLESPLAAARMILHEKALGAIAALAKPSPLRGIEDRLSDLSIEAISLLLSLLAEAGMLQEVGGDGRERESSALSYWEFHDLLFHARSRKGRCDAPFGATYRMAGSAEPPPARKPDSAGATCELYRPDPQQLRRTDPSFAEVVERRRSLRDYDDHPITVRQLGEFLYRTVRVKDCRAVELTTPSGRVNMDFLSRPYPSGGALYELEFYVAVRACEGLAPGLYHYDGLHHRLVCLPPRTAEVEHLLNDAAASAAIPSDSVQVLLLLSARFPRLAWKYSSIAYSLILKHVGVVYQTMYLTAAAMNLSPCALGGGDADVFARAAGTDYHEETSVGEFLLGSAKESCNNTF